MFEGNRKDGICTCLAENAEADTLAHVNDNADFAQFHPVSVRAKSSGNDRCIHCFESTVGC